MSGKARERMFKTKESGSQESESRIKDKIPLSETQRSKGKKTGRNRNMHVDILFCAFFVIDADTLLFAILPGKSASHFDRIYMI